MRGEPVRLTASARASLERPRNLVIMRMLVAVSCLLDGPQPDWELWGHCRDKMIEAMAAPGARCAMTSADDGGEHYRRLALDVAESISEEAENDRIVKWARILREILRSLPECDALAA
jgi:hypothetical protein